VGKSVHLVLQPLANGFLRVYGLVERAYPPMLRMALRNPGKVLLTVALLLGLSIWRGRSLGQEILPEVHQGEFYVEAFLARSATVRATDEIMQSIERDIRALPEVERTFLAAGVDPDELNDSEEGKHSARIQVVLRPASHRAEQEQRVRGAISARIAAEPSILSHRFATASVLQFQADLVVEVIGHDLVNLRRACEQVAMALGTVPHLGFVRSTLQRGNPELTIKLDRDKLAALKLDAEATARILRTKVLGDVPTLFAERERKIDMRVRIDRQELDSEDRLRAVNINPAGYPEIPLSAVAEIVRREGPSEIRRLGNVRGAEVHAQIRGFDMARAQLDSQKEELERSNRSLLLAMALAVFLVYIVMAAQFESVLQPIIIMLSVPLAMIGAVIALSTSGTDLSVIVFLGGIVLAGIVVNNGIILIDQINQLRSEGMPFDQAVLEGATSRVRPVMMTMLSSLIGLLPQTGWLASLPFLGGSTDGIELRAPMAVTVIAGLLSSTLLTLIVVPLVYSRIVRRTQA
jgi:HAE1 family hydrophobic/amphiphilic exporter-1